MSLSNKCVWIFVGSTGVGKSTLISVLSNEQVATSSSAESCTTKSTLYCHKSYDDIKLLDTQGAEDTKESLDTDFKPKVSDTEILERMCEILGKADADTCKVIWVIKPQDKRTPALQQQANFIRSLNPNSIWNSVAIVCKQGAELASFQGALKAAKTNGKMSCYKKLPCLSLHLLDNVNHNSKQYRSIVKESLHERTSISDNGDEISEIYVYKKELSTFANNFINKNIDSCSIRIQKTYIHPGSFEPEYELYHSGEFKMDGSSKFGFWALGIMTAGIGNGIAAIGNAHDKERAWTCCHVRGRHSSGCQSRVKGGAWTCCYEISESDQGCQEKWVPDMD